jgi:hypothetical protein
MTEKKQIVEFINNICNKKYGEAKVNLAQVVDLKVKERIKAIENTQK